MRIDTSEGCLRGVELRGGGRFVLGALLSVVAGALLGRAFAAGAGYGRGKAQAAVDLRRNLGLFESLKALDILALSGPELVNGRTEFLKGLFGFCAVEG